MYLWYLDNHLLQKLSEVITNTFTSWPLAHSMTIEGVWCSGLFMQRTEREIMSIKNVGYYDQRLGQTGSIWWTWCSEKQKKHTCPPSTSRNLMIIDTEYYWGDTSVLKNTQPGQVKSPVNIFSKDFHLVKLLRTTCVNSRKPAPAISFSPGD